MNPPREHVPEIDWLKGFAILGVIWIHSKPYDESFFFLQVINRAVPIFLVLFGLSSELWWQREMERASERTALRWYGGRLLRLLPPYWAMIAIWWLLVVFWRQPGGNFRLGGLEVLLSFFGYAPWVGTSWFVTLILQYILLFPLLRWVTLRVPALLCLLVSGAATFASGWFSLQIVSAATDLLGSNLPPPGWYYVWAFFPRALWNVTAGIFIARWWQGQVSMRATGVALIVTAAGAFLTEMIRASNDFWAPVREFAVAAIVDVPLTVALLGLFRWTPLPEKVALFLRWCGLRSWGLYLAHLLIHELIQLGGAFYSVGEQWVRIVYGLALFVGGAAVVIVLTRADQEIRRWVGLRQLPSSP